MNPFGRVAACGMISAYNEAQLSPGSNNLMLIVAKKFALPVSSRPTMQRTTIYERHGGQ